MKNTCWSELRRCVRFGLVWFGLVGLFWWGGGQGWLKGRIREEGGGRKKKPRRSNEGWGGGRNAGFSYNL